MWAQYKQQDASALGTAKQRFGAMGSAPVEQSLASPPLSGTRLRRRRLSENPPKCITVCYKSSNVRGFEQAAYKNDRTRIAHLFFLHHWQCHNKRGALI